MISELAVINFFIIFIVIMAGFGVVQIVKKRFED